MASLAIIICAVFKEGFFKISLIFIALLQVACFWLKLIVIYYLFFCLFNFIFFLQFFNIKNFIIVLRLVIHTCMLAFEHLKWFSFVSLRINLNIFVNHTFVLIVNRDCLIWFVFFGFLIYFLLMLAFFQYCIIWLWVMIKFLFFSSKSSLFLLGVSDYYMPTFSFDLIEKLLSMASNLGTWSRTNIFLHFLPIFSENL
jgi:hypothetical protein